MKVCAKCKVAKPFTEFTKAIKRKDGHNPYCKSCTKEWREENKDVLKIKKQVYYENNKELMKEKNKIKYINNKDKFKKYQSYYYSSPENWAKRMINKTAQRANDAGLDFDIEVDDLIFPRFCPYLNTELTYVLGQGQLPTNASIDRVDSTKGYVKGNVQIISRLANTMKSNATIDQLVTFSQNVIKMYNSR